MSNLAYKLNETFTYADYSSWDTSDMKSGERFELIDGIAYAMSAPVAKHQKILRELSGLLWSFLKGKPFEVFTAPFDVRLFPEDDESDTTVVQPDILVICDKSKLSDGRACKGAPDLIIEILSPASVMMDRQIKAEKYRIAGVKEYWIVNPDTLDIMINRLADGRYVSAVYTDIAESAVLPGFKVDLNSVRMDVTI